ncbi:MAG: PhnA domain-containing protein [Psychroflexus sp.]|nr:PhnA domain-containing protein [Psychroflexus sp.]MDN6310699.1 PhnA domain-containing protein [Psychroflexus sp.]
MSLEQDLMQRAESKCELCGSKDQLEIYEVPPVAQASLENAVLTCKTCYDQLNNSDQIESNHWRCLNDSMWSQVPAVQVIAYRMLHQLIDEGWPQDLIDMLYLEEQTLAWAKTTLEEEKPVDQVIHRDSNGVEINAGDNIVLIKDLPVKGSSLVAKRGTAVRRVSLVHDNEEQVEGRVEGQQIVILTKFVKKI